MIQLENLEIVLGAFHLQDVTLTIEVGEYMVLLGPTGHGKSVLVECVVGIRRPDKGRILIDGRDVTINASIGAALIHSLVTRIPLELDVIRDRNALYRQVDKQYIENVYTLKIINMDTMKHTYHVTVSGISGVEFANTPLLVRVNSGEVVSQPARVRIKQSAITKTSNRLEFQVRSLDDRHVNVSEHGRFIAPLKK